MATVESLGDMRADLAALTARVEELERRRKKPPASVANSGTDDAPTATAIESRFGSYWASRLGIVSLVTGVAFLIGQGFDRIGPFLKASLGYVCAVALACFGRWVMRRHQALGRILVSGGLGVAYYTTYAIHHVESVQLITSPALGFALLAAAVLAIVFAAQAMQSETVAGLALFLGLHTGMVSDVGVFTLASGCLLAAGAAYFMAKNRWVIVPISTLVAVYSTLLTWLLGNPLTSSAGIVHPAGHLTAALIFIALYYATFAVATALAPRNLPRSFDIGIALLNWAAAALVSAFELSHHGAGGLEIVFVVLAATSLLLAVVRGRRVGQDASFHLHLALTTASVALGAWAVFDAGRLAIALCVVAVSAAVLARSLKSLALRVAGAAVALVAVVSTLESGADSAIVAVVVIATLVAIERLLPSSERDLDLSRLAPAFGAILVALATVSALAPPALVTAAWVGASAVLFAIGLGLSALPYRLVALGGIGLSFARLFLHDLASYAAGYRIASFLIVGVLLLAISYVYTRRNDLSAGSEPTSLRAAIAGSASPEAATANQEECAHEET